MRGNKEIELMPLDPQAKSILTKMALYPPTHASTPAQARVFLRAMLVTGKVEQVAHVENHRIAGPLGKIPLRVYTPAGTGPFPILIFFHGGGMVIGDLESYDALCRSLTNLAGCLVVSVDYRLAPEHKFPAALEDSYAATNWVAAHATQFNGDSSRIAVGGDSAGGSLATTIARMVRDREDLRLVFQVLIYPITDMGSNTPSMQEYAEGYGLTRKDVIWYINHYLNNKEEKTNPLASPLLAPDLSGLPPALVITAEFDPLRDEGEQYARKLEEAGVPLRLSRYNGMIHGFMTMAGFLDQGRQALSEIATALQGALAIK
jgi:acetyl esterase